MALANQRIFLRYDVPGPELWHERLVLAHARNEDYAVATPDSDVYIEQLSLLNRDLRGMRARGPGGGLPVGIRAVNTYPLPAFTAAQLAALQAEGDRVVAEELGRQGPGQAGAAVGHAVAGAAPAAQPAVAPLAAEPSAAGDPVFEAGTLCWLAAECVGGYRYGDAVAGVVAAAAAGVKSVHALPAGGSIFVECVRGDGRDAFLRRAGLNDPRTLGLVLDMMGRPETTLKDAAQLSIEKKMGWTLSGPRTAKWCISYLVVENMGLEGHHERFRQVCRLDASNWGVSEHFNLSMVIKTAVLNDQLNPFNLLSLEILFRRLQTIEYSYSEKAREAESKAAGGRLSLEEQTVFGGVTRLASTLMICPDLLDYVKAETEKEASLAKNLRKAREERELARRKKGPKGGGDDQ